MLKFLNIFAPAGVGVIGILGTAYMMADQLVVDMPAPVRGNIIVPALADAPMQMAAADHVEARDGGYDLGRDALTEEVAAWDIDVRPDGQGLPEGSGDVVTGEELYLDNCAMCHGDFGEAIGRWPVLAGGEGTLESERPVKTIGSYWPYASTIWDYVHRAMPFGNAESLTDNDVYALTAYLLYLNFLVEDDFVLSNVNFAEVTLPNEPNFFTDDRADGEIPAFTIEPCMESCKDSVEITARAAVVDVTPEDSGVVAPERGTDEAAVVRVAEDPTEMADTPADESTEEAPTVVSALVAEGEGVFRKCRSCHQIGEGAQNRSGPQLNGIVGRDVGAEEDFRYSNVMAEDGGTWDADRLAEFLADPRGVMRGTKMSFVGLRDEAEITAIIAYLSTFE